MAGKVNITVDEAVYEYSCFIWKKITGEKPESVISRLLDGKGVISNEDLTIQKKIDELMRRANLFVPRVRLEKDYGYRRDNARWYRKLLMKRRSLKSTVVYLTDAVNEVIQNPYNEEIINLWQSVKELLILKVDGKPITQEQDEKIKEVTSKVAEQKKIIRRLPKCTNMILATMLHEYVDNITYEDREAIENNLTQIEANIIKCKKMKNMLDFNEDDSDRRIEYETYINNIEKNSRQLEQRNYEIRRKYYEKFYSEMTPEKIAEQLLRYPATVWEAFNIEKKSISIDVKISSPSKERKKKKKKQVNLEEQTKKLLLFPFKVESSMNDAMFLYDLDFDLRVTDEFDRWAKNYDGRTFDDEYKLKYEEFRSRLNSHPLNKRKRSEITVTKDGKVYRLWT